MTRKVVSLSVLDNVRGPFSIQTREITCKYPDDSVGSPYPRYPIFVVFMLIFKHAAVYLGN